MLIHTTEEHPIVEVQTWRDADIFKEHKRRRTAQRVLQAVIPILYIASELFINTIVKKIFQEAKVE